MGTEIWRYIVIVHSLQLVSFPYKNPHKSLCKMPIDKKHKVWYNISTVRGKKTLLSGSIEPWSKAASKNEWHRIAE